MTAIKICGITRQDDANAAVDFGTDALGFIFYRGSPRVVAFQVAAKIVASLSSSVLAVGVYVNPSAEQLGEAARAGFAVAQVHGDMPNLHGKTAPLRILRAVKLSPDDVGFHPAVPGDDPVLLDAHDPQFYGGTGRPIDWVKARAIAERRKIFLAGGLTPDNVRDAIKTVRPYAVDVASGTEASPGIKDHDKLKAFIYAVKETV